MRHEQRFYEKWSISLRLIVREQRPNGRDIGRTGRFYPVDDGATISDYWLSASFYV
jgi:hypothetical protein